MKKSNSTQKALGAFKKLGAVALITATVFFTACNQTGGGGNTGGSGGEKPKPTPTPTKYTVTLTQTANGKVTASPEIPEDKKVAKDTVITFTAKADEGYKIGKWTVTGSALEANTGAEGSSTAKVKITANTTVSVSFEANSNPPNPPTPTKYTVTLNKTEHGTVTASPSHAIPQDGKVDENTEITFTATADSGYRVNTWVISPNSAIQSGGGKGETTATLKITANTTVRVSFEEIPKHAINFSVDSNTPNGTLKAEGDGINQPATSPITVEEGKTVIFTAEPNTDYRVKEWKVGDTVVKGNKTNIYKHPVTEPATITVSFERIPEGAILTLATGKNTVSVMAKTEGDSAITVVGCTVETFSSGNQTELQTNGATVTLKGDIIELHVIGSYQIMGPLTALDVSGLAKLQKLQCDSNQLTSLNVQGCVALQELNCDSNQLTSLDVSNLIALQKLHCSYNKKSPGNQTLTELNVQGCTALQTLNCTGNRLTELDVQSLTGLQTLLCSQNKLNRLNVEDLTALEDLDCGENNLTALDVSKLTKLKKLNCGKNKLTSLNASDLAALENINCVSNQLTKLRVKGCTSLNFLSCLDNQLGTDAFTKLFGDLPTYQGNDVAIARLYTEDTDVTEGNCKNFKTPDGLRAAFDGAKTKKWKLMKMSASGIDEPIN